jgi:ATP-dependent protease ClpP protease subunit
MRNRMWQIIIGLVVAVGALLFVTQATANETQQVKLGLRNTVVLRGEINDKTAQVAALELIALNGARLNRDYPIYLVLDSPGGSIEAGENLIEIIKSIKNIKTITLFAASMASAIVEANPGDRLILDDGILMFHRAKGGVQGQFETGEMETRLDFYKRFVRRMEQRSANRMHLSLSDYKAKIKDELWLTASESLLKGAADEIVTVSCTQGLIDKTQHMTVDVIIFKVELDFSGCPLLKSPSVTPGQPEQAVEAYQKYGARIGAFDGGF